MRTIFWIIILFILYRFARRYLNARAAEQARLRESARRVEERRAAERNGSRIPRGGIDYRDARDATFRDID